MQPQRNSFASVIGKIAGYVIVILILLFVVGLLLIGVDWAWSKLF